MTRGKRTKTVNYSPGSGITVRLRGKLLKGNKTSLYLDYYTGYSVSESGKTITHRKTEYLKIYLHTTPYTNEERQSNKELLKLAQNIRNLRESDLAHNPEGFISPHKKKTNFWDYCQQYESSYTKKDIRMIQAAIRTFKEFIEESYILPKQIEEKTVTNFRDYLLDNFNGETPNSYFKRFKKILRAAVNDGLFTKSPAENIYCSIPEGIRKAILTEEEVSLIAKTECPNTEIRRAFLFSLMTGFRFCDVKSLQYKHIQNNQVWKPQTKVENSVYVDLNKSAKTLIGEVGKPETLVFDLPSGTTCYKTLKKWTKAAGIDKNITWHSARHTVGTLLLSNGANIITVKNVLGHSKLEHTQRYTHVVDELKKKAVNGLPHI